MRVCKLTATNASFTHIQVEARSPFGTATMELPMSLSEFKTAVAKWDAGAMVQNAFPNLNATQREFLITGLSEEEQQKFFDTEE